MSIQVTKIKKFACTHFGYPNIRIKIVGWWQHH